MAFELVTGYTGQPHITAKQDAVLNAAAFETSRKYIIGVGNQFECELQSNTSIRINDGYALNQGRLMGMPNHDYTELDISPGITGAKRTDLVVIHYAKDNSTGIENAYLKVIEGVAGEDYVEPEYSENDLLNGDFLEDDFVLYRVKIDGLSISEIEQVANVWYLDTGWRTDLLEFDWSGASGPPMVEDIAMRVKGNQVFLAGFHYLFIQQNQPLTITFEKKYAPSKQVYIDRQVQDTYIYYRIYPEGYMEIFAVGSEGSSPDYLALDGMSWFID